MTIKSWIKSVVKSSFQDESGIKTFIKEIKKTNPRSILEIGLGDGQRGPKILAALDNSGEDRIRYTGIDMFEARLGGLLIRKVHQQISQTGALCKLVPGEPMPALSRTANSLASTDLILIDSMILPNDLDAAWYYFPRMMHAGTQVFQQVTDGDSMTYRRLDNSKVESLANRARPSRSAA